MRLLITSELRDLVRKPFNAFFVVGSLTVAVMSVLVTHQLSLYIIERLGNSGLETDFDYVIYLEDKTEAEYLELRARWRKDSQQDISHVVPIVEGNTLVGGQLVPVLGFDPVATLPSYGVEGMALASNPEFLLSDSLIALGLTTPALESIQEAKVIESIQSSAPRLLADLPTAQSLLKRPQAIDAVWLKETQQPSTWWEQIVPGLTSATKSAENSREFIGYEAVPFSRWNPTSQLADAIVFNLGMLSLLTLLVAGFIVFQANQSNLRSRETQFELLDVMGLSMKEQRLLAFVQASVCGLLGCGLGLFSGVVLLSIVNTESISGTWEQLANIAIIKSLSLGLITTTLVACLVSFKHHQKPLWLWLVVTAITLAGVLYGLSEESGLLGASLLSVCFCVLNVFCLMPLCSRLAILLMRRLRTNSLLVRMNFRKAIATVIDVRLAINALVIAIATAIGIGLMLESFRTEFETLLEQRLNSDLHLTNAAGFDPVDFERRPEVQVVSEYHTIGGSLNGNPVQVVVADLDSREQERYGYKQVDLPELFVSEKTAQILGVESGGAVSLTLPGNPTQTLSISHVFKDYGESSLRVIVNRNQVQTDGYIADRYSISTTNKDVTRSALDAQYPNFRIADNEELRELSLLAFDRSFAFAQIMVNVAIFVAVAGMVCALLGIQASRLKEMRLLLMMGVSRTRLIVDSLTQNAILGTFSVIVALPLAGAIAWNLCYFVNPRAYGWSFDLQLSWQPILVPTLFGLLAAMCAGLEPLRRAFSEVIAQPLSNVR